MATCDGSAGGVQCLGIEVGGARWCSRLVVHRGGGVGERGGRQQSPVSGDIEEEDARGVWVLKRFSFTPREEEGDEKLTWVLV